MPAKYVTNLLPNTPHRSPYGWADFGSHSCSRRKRVWRLWVLRLQEALLIQMNYFERHLESRLDDMLDPIVNAPVAARQRRKGGKTVQEIRVLDLPAVTPAAVPVPVEAFA